MRLYEFLSLVLDAQGEVLRELAEGLNDLPEFVDTSAGQPKSAILKSIERVADAAGSSDFDPNAFERLERSVEGAGLSEDLQLAVWSYPFYRGFVESSLPLTLELGAEHGISSETLIEEAVRSGEEWMRELAVPAHYRNAADAIARHAWLRFRARAMQRLGFQRLRPM